jgi:hypothetical protein
MEPTSHPIDERALRRWTDTRLKKQGLQRIPGEFGNTHAEGFERCITHVSFQQFLEALQRSVRLLFKHLDGRPYITSNQYLNDIIPGSNKPSNAWVFDLAKKHDMLEYDPTPFTFSKDDIHKKRNLNTIVFFDDMAYSGSQMYSRLQLFYNIPQPLEAYLVIPFLGLESIKRFRLLKPKVTLENFHLIKNEPFKYDIQGQFSCTEYSQDSDVFTFNNEALHNLPHGSHYSTSILEFRDWKQACVTSIKTNGKSAFIILFDKIVGTYAHCMDNFDSAMDKPITTDLRPTIYFDHKLSDEMSIPKKVMKGFVFEDKYYPMSKDNVEDWWNENYIPFIKGCQDLNQRYDDKCPMPPYKL